jgi:hypothetical protein
MEPEALIDYVTQLLVTALIQINSVCKFITNLFEICFIITLTSMCSWKKWCVSVFQASLG